MRQVHCSKCWQQNALLTRRCAYCGDFDKIRLGKGIAELLIYLAGGAAASGAVVWTAVVLF